MSFLNIFLSFPADVLYLYCIIPTLLLSLSIVDQSWPILTNLDQSWPILTNLYNVQLRVASTVAGRWSKKWLLKILLQHFKICLDLKLTLLPLGSIFFKQRLLIPFPDTNVGGTVTDLGIDHDTDGVLVNALGCDLRGGKDVTYRLHRCIALLPSPVSVFGLFSWLWFVICMYCIVMHTY